MDFELTKQAAIEEKERLEQRRTQIVAEKKTLDNELDGIKRKLIGLDQIFEGLEVATLEVPFDLEPLGFTDHIKHLLQTTTVPLLPTQIRDSCLNAGFKGSSLKNLLICVHNVLERYRDELDEKPVEGKKAYIWKWGGAPPVKSNPPWVGQRGFLSMLADISTQPQTQPPQTREPLVPRRRVRLERPAQPSSLAKDMEDAFNENKKK